jgi:hypothetical protein
MDVQMEQKPSSPYLLMARHSWPDKHVPSSHARTSATHVAYGAEVQNKKFWEELLAYFPWYDMGHIENDASNNFSIVACVFVTAVTSLRSRCLATIGGYTYRHRLMGGIFSLLSLFWKIEQAYEIMLLSLCVSVYHPIVCRQRLV